MMAETTRNALRFAAGLAGALAFVAVGFGSTTASSGQPAEDCGGAGPARLTLTWSTATEAAVYGFLVLRAETEAGPFRPVSEEPVPGAGDSDVLRHYRFDDTAVACGRTYFYTLESVSLTGERRRKGAIVSKRCCGPAEADSAPPAGRAAGATSRVSTPSHEGSSRPRSRDASREKERP